MNKRFQWAVGGGLVVGILLLTQGAGTIDNTVYAPNLLVYTNASIRGTATMASAAITNGLSAGSFSVATNATVNGALYLPAYPTGQALVQSATAAAGRAAIDAANVGIDVTIPPYSADPTGVTDSTLAIQTAATACGTTNTLVMPSGTYKTTSTVTVLSPIRGSGATILSSVSNAPALKVGDGLSSITEQSFFLPKVRRTSDLWTNAPSSDVGIQLNRLVRCEVHAPQVESFTVGLECLGENGGFVHNNIFLGYLFSNMTNLWLHGTGTGWCNDNSFYGGLLGNVSNYGTNLTGCVFIALDGVNQAQFFGTGMEGVVPQYYVYSTGEENAFYSCRWESGSATYPPVVYFGGNSHVIFGGYQPDTVSITSDRPRKALVYDDHSFRLLTGSSEGDGTTATLELQNIQDSDSPVLNVYDANQVILTNRIANQSNFNVRVSSAKIQTKATNDTVARLSIATGTGTMSFSDGSTAADVTFSRSATNRLESSQDFRALRSIIGSYGLFGTTTQIVNCTVAVQGASMGQIGIKNPNTGGTTWHIGSSDNGWAAGGGKLIFNDSANSTPAKLTLTSTSVGIGTASPGEMLEVAGSIKVSGTATSIQGGHTNVIATSGTPQTLFYISVPNTNSLSGDIIWKLFATDGTDTQSQVGHTLFDSVAKSTTVTAGVTSITNAAVCSGGTTLSGGLTANVATNNVLAIQATLTTSLTTTNMLIKWRIQTPSVYSVTAL